MFGHAPAPGPPFPALHQDLRPAALLCEEINAWVNEGGRGGDQET